MKPGVHACLSRRRSRVRIPSSPPIGQIAQSVEHLSEKQGVGSSILPLATINIGLFCLQNQTFKKCDQNCDDALASFIESYAVSSFSKKFPKAVELSSKDNIAAPNPVTKGSPISPP